MEIGEAKVIDQQEATSDGFDVWQRYLILERLECGAFQLDIRREDIYTRGHLIDGMYLVQESGPFLEVIFESPNEDIVEDWLEKSGWWLDNKITKALARECKL
jgi:hypothetical protein